MRKIAFIISFLCLSQGVFAQQVEAYIDSVKVLLGNTVGYHIKISGEGIENPQSNLAVLDTLENYGVVYTGDWKKTADGSAMVQDLIIAPYAAGKYRIPNIKVSFQQAGRTISANTKQIPLEGVTAVMAPQDILGNRAIAHEAMNMEEFLPILIGLGIFLGLLGLGYYFYKEKNKKEIIEIPEVIIPAHEIALEKLKNLKDSKIWVENPKSFHSRLSLILRGYLGGRFDIHALESTTNEILDDMKGANINADNRDQFKQIFEMADLVKFAKAKPPKDIHETILKFATEFVQTTKAIPEPIEKDS